MKLSHTILDCIGQTPIIQLTKFNPNLSFNLFAKCEMFNPTLSIKDRIVYSMIQDLEAQGILKPGMTLIEASSGNTGTSLAMIGSVLGYRTLIFVPKKTSSEKINTMRIYGAEVTICPDVASSSPEYYIHQAQALSLQTSDAILLGQYENPINTETHFKHTAVELWEQMEGKIDYLVAAASTGGTITGIAKFLKSKNPKIKIIMPDPVGSIFYHYFRHKNYDTPSMPYKVEGAGKDKVCPIHDFNYIDDVLQFTDEQAFAAVKQLAKREGILAGGSSGGILAVAEQLLEVPHDANVVVILPDSGFKYLSLLASC